jgi:hypothetical protein
MTLRECGVVIPRIVRAIDYGAEALGLLRQPLLPSDLIAIAQRITGLREFEDANFEEALALLLQSFEREADLSVIGRMAAKWDIVRFLSNLLRLREAERRTPGILDQSIEQPIFITGLPRSGSTFLHRLLGQDRSNLVVRSWETIYPLPEEEGGAAARARAVDRQLAIFAKMAPDFQHVHPITAQSPQECTEITAHVFRSLRFDTTHHVPSYQRWLDDTGHFVAYAFHRRFLRHLQLRKGSGRWVLKSPDHVFALDAILSLYPDARFVFTHRDPLQVLPSVARLTEVLRRPFARHIDRAAIGRQVTRRWESGALTMMEAAQTARIPPERVFHMRFPEFIRDPIASVTSLYRYFGLPLRPGVAKDMQSLVAGDPNAGYRGNKALATDYGIDLREERYRFSGYVACFGV